jgi:CheY-like chemotaxis protein
VKLLVVENDEEFASALTEDLAVSAPNVDAVRASNKADAVSLLASDSFDLVVCDLRIPSAGGLLDESVEHGLAVHGESRLTQPGTPVIVLSAYGTLDIVKELYEVAPREDAFASGTAIPLTTFFPKNKLPELLGQIVEYAAQIEVIESVDVSRGGRPMELAAGDRRVLRLFAVRHGGAVVQVRPVGGGLSSTRVIAATIIDSNGAVVSRSLARIASLQDIRSEVQRYRELVLPQLGAGGFAHLIDEVRAGASALGGAFYWFAGGVEGEGFDRTLFEIVADNPDAAAGVVQRLRAKLGPWTTAAHQESEVVGDVRKSLIDDEGLDRAQTTVPGDVKACESRAIHCRRGPQHGDLHGGNVLVRGDGEPVLIDFGALRRGPVALDAITLELSLLFHPDSPVRDSEWPDPATADRWFDLERYVAHSPCAAVVRACREWAYASAASDREIAAVVYAYAVRQLKFSDTDHQLALALARAAANELSV